MLPTRYGGKMVLAFHIHSHGEYRCYEVDEKKDTCENLASGYETLGLSTNNTSDVAGGKLLYSYLYVERLYGY